MAKIALSFGSPDHGSLAVRLSCDGKARKLDASDVPADSLHMLASAVLQVLEGRATEATVKWFVQPEQETWSIRRDGDVCQLDVCELGADTKVVRFAEGSTREICGPIWRALRRLEGDPAWTSETSWKHPFPAQEVAALASKVRSERRQSA